MRPERRAWLLAGRRWVAALVVALAVSAANLPAASAATVTISGRVTLPDGGPAAGFEIVALLRYEDSYFRSVPTAITDPDGEYALEVDALNVGEGVLIEATPPADQPFVATTYHGDVTTWRDGTFVTLDAAPMVQNIHAVAGGVVEGTVSRAGGPPEENTQVRAWGEDSRLHSDVDADGSYSIAHLAPGRHRIEVSQRDPDSGWTTLSHLDGSFDESDAAATVDVVSGSTRSGVDIDVPAHVATMQPVVPSRLIDTRSGRPDGVHPVPKARLVPGSVLRVDTAAAVAAGALPRQAEDDSVALALNLTITGATTRGYVEVSPCGGHLGTSAANFMPGTTAANAVVVAVPGEHAAPQHQGRICITTSSPVHVIVDLAGWFPVSGGYQAVGPARVFDTRAGRPSGTVPIVHQPVGPDRVLRVELAGTSGLPEDDIAAVSLNLTAVGRAPRGTPGYVTAYPCTRSTSPRPPTSSLNYGSLVNGEATANAAIVTVAARGGICFYASSPIDLVVDVGGSFEADRGTQVLAGTRLADTRPGRAPLSTTKHRVGGSRVLTVPTGADPAAILNVTAVAGGSPGYLTVHPCGRPRPNVSNINFEAGQVVANLVLSKVAGDGAVCIYASTPIDVVVDLTGRVQGAAGYGGPPAGYMPPTWFRLPA